MLFDVYLIKIPPPRLEGSRGRGCAVTVLNSQPLSLWVLAQSFAVVPVQSRYQQLRCEVMEGDEPSSFRQTSVRIKFVQSSAARVVTIASAWPACQILGTDSISLTP